MITEDMSKKRVLEFNSQFEGFADRKEGINVQEFMALCNLIREWNKNNPSDIINIKFGTGNGAIKSVSGKNIESFIKNETNSMEDLVTIFFNSKPEEYYFRFPSNEIKYNDEARISEITVYMMKI